MRLKTNLSIIITFFISSVLFGVNNLVNKSSDFEKNYIGQINDNLQVAFHIENKEGVISGFYYYQKIGIDIRIVGKITSQKLDMYELDYKNDTLARIQAVICDSTIDGEWVNIKSKKSFSIRLKETIKKISPLPTNIEGVYIADTESGCNLSLRISKKKGEYYYNFKSDIRNINGKISFAREDNLYLTLDGIEWAQDYFDVGLPEENELSKQYEELQKEGKRQVGVDGSLSTDEITIQNYGNAMNYFVKLKDCGSKYINLRK